VSFVSITFDGLETSCNLGLLEINPSLAAFFWLALWAASAPACRIAMVSGVSPFLASFVLMFLWPSAGSSICMWSVLAEALEGAEMDSVGASREGGGFEGVLAVEVAGVTVVTGAAPICCFNSPYSFHSSISSRSCRARLAIPKMHTVE
jgi:hypothetical protein